MKKSARNKNKFSIPKFISHILHTKYYILYTLILLCLLGLSIGIYYIILPKLTPPKAYAQNTLGSKEGVRWIDTQADQDNLRQKPIVLRDAYSTHFKNPDGTVTALFTGFKQNYEVAPGVWEPIDYSLEKSTDPRYDYQTKNGVGIYLSKNGALAQKNGDSLLESGAPTLGLYNPISGNFEKLNNLDNPKVVKDDTNNSLILDGQDVKLIVYAYDTGVREDLILKNSSLVDNASYNDLLTLKAPITTSGNLTLNEQPLNTKYYIPNTIYELTSQDSLVLKDNDQTVNFPFPQGHDAKDNPAKIRRFLIKEGDSWYLYTSISVSWLKKLSTSYPVTVDPDYNGASTDGYINGNSSPSCDRTTWGSSYSSALMRTGCFFESTVKRMVRGYLEFDTHLIPDTAIINQVNLKLTASIDGSSTDFDIQIADFAWSSPLASATNEANWDGCLNATTDAVWRNTNGMVVNTPYSSNNLSTSWPSKTGNTQYCLISSADKNNTQGTNTYNATLYASEAANSTYRPLLTVTYQPVAPTATAATNITSSGFDANWGSQAASGADGYSLDVGTDNPPTQFVNGCGGSTCNNYSVGNVTTYSVTGLSANTTYYYRLKSTDSVGTGTSAYSNVISVTTAPAAPTANSVTNTAIAVDSTSTGSGSNVASISWSHTISGSNRLLVVGVTKRAYNSVTSVTYNGVALTKSGAVQAGSGDYSRSELWYLVNPPTGANTIVVTPGGNDWMQAGAVSFTGVDQFTPLGTFASNSGGSFATSASVSVSSLPGEVVIDSLAFWNGSLDATKGNNQTLKWSASSDGAWKGRGSTAPYLGTAATVTSSWTIPTSGAQGWALAAVSIKPVNVLNHSSFSGSWNAVSGATSYKFALSTAAGCNASYVASTSCPGGTCNLADIGNVTSYIISNGLSANATYYYCVKASNASGDSTLSTPVQFQMAPSLPTNVTFYSAGDTSFAFDFDTITGANTYKVMVDDNSDFSSPLASYSPGSVNSSFASITTGVSSGTTYYYKVASTGDGGTSTYTAPQSVTTFSSSPTLQAATNVSQEGFQVNWSAATGASNYFLEVARDASFYQYVPGFGYNGIYPPGKQIPAPTLAYALSRLQPSTTYYYRIRSQNASNYTSYPVYPAPTIITSAGISSYCNTGIGTTTFTWNCTPADTTEFISGGNLTISSNTTLTLSNQNFIWEPGKSITLGSNSHIVHNTGSKIQQGYPIYPDSDQDGYPDSLTPTISYNAPNGTTYKSPSQLATNGWYTMDCDSSLNTAYSDCSSKKVFYTTSNTKGNIGSVSAANQFCQDQANAAGLYGTYRAWLSDDTNPAKDQITPGPYKYTLVDGTTVVAYSFSEFTSGTGLTHAIDKSEANASNQKYIWTNTTALGTRTSTSGGTCTNWTVQTGNGNIGNNSLAGTRWTNDTVNTPQACNTAGIALYCIQQ